MKGIRKLVWSQDVRIRCPECNFVQDAKIEFYEGDPWQTYVHTCTQCKYVIMESEWNEVTECAVCKKEFVKEFDRHDCCSEECWYKRYRNFHPSILVTAMKFNRGDKVILMVDQFDAKGRIRAKKGSKGIVLSDNLNRTISVQVEGKHYPINEVLENEVALRE